MVAVLGQTPITTQPPPLQPTLADENLSRYLTTFSSWVLKNLSAKLPSGQALPGVLVQAYDTAPGAPPKVFLIRVNSLGVISATAQSLGEGKP